MSLEGKTIEIEDLRHGVQRFRVHGAAFRQGATDKASGWALLLERLDGENASGEIEQRMVSSCFLRVVDEKAERIAVEFHRAKIERLAKYGHDTEKVRRALAAGPRLVITDADGDVTCFACGAVWPWPTGNTSHECGRCGALVATTDAGMAEARRKWSMRRGAYIDAGKREIQWSEYPRRMVQVIGRGASADLKAPLATPLAWAVPAWAAAAASGKLAESAPAPDLRTEANALAAELDIQLRWTEEPNGHDPQLVRYGWEAQRNGERFGEVVDSRDRASGRAHADFAALAWLKSISDGRVSALGVERRAIVEWPRGRAPTPAELAAAVRAEHEFDQTARRIPGVKNCDGNIERPPAGVAWSAGFRAGHVVGSREVLANQKTAVQNWLSDLSWHGLSNVQSAARSSSRVMADDVVPIDFKADPERVRDWYRRAAPSPGRVAHAAAAERVIETAEVRAKERSGEWQDLHAIAHRLEAHGAITGQRYTIGEILGAIDKLANGAADAERARDANVRLRRQLAADLDCDTHDASLHEAAVKLVRDLAEARGGGTVAHDAVLGVLAGRLARHGFPEAKAVLTRDVRTIGDALLAGIDALAARGDRTLSERPLVARPTVDRPPAEVLNQRAAAEDVLEDFRADLMRALGWEITPRVAGRPESDIVTAVLDLRRGLEGDRLRLLALRRCIGDVLGVAEGDRGDDVLVSAAKKVKSYEPALVALRRRLVEALRLTPPGDYHDDVIVMSVRDVRTDADQARKVVESISMLVSGFTGDTIIDRVNEVIAKVVRFRAELTTACGWNGISDEDLIKQARKFCAERNATMGKLSIWEEVGATYGVKSPGQLAGVLELGKEEARNSTAEVQRWEAKFREWESVLADLIGFPAKSHEVQLELEGRIRTLLGMPAAPTPTGKRYCPEPDPNEAG